MASLLSKLPFSFYTLTLCFLSSLPFICSLSTVAISETANQTLICASIHSSNQLSYLNCTSFPHGIQIPLTRLTTSGSGIVAGNGFLCSLSSPSNVSIMGCWRFSPQNTETVTYKRIYKDTRLKELRAGNSHICGLVNQTSDLQCWQWRKFNSSKTQQNFTKLAVGEDFVCGLSESGSIKCLLEQNGTHTVVGHEPGGSYRVIAAGFRHACAISLNGSLSCWGEMAGEKPPQDDGFTSLALGENRSCAMRPNGTVTCWGQSNFSLPQNLRNANFIAIEAKRNIFCGIELSNYSLYCWGNEILDSDPIVFHNVVPGVCTDACPCSRPSPLYGKYCSKGLMICEPCDRDTTSLVSVAPPQSPLVPAAPPQSPAKGDGWSNKMVAFLVVGCVGSLSLVIVCCFLFFRYCKSRKCQVHDSGPLDEERNPNPMPALEKKLSQLVSMGNGCGHLEEFSLQALDQVTNNFSEDHKIGAGSFGSVYYATLEDGRQVAIKRAESSSSSHPHDEEKDCAFLNELEFMSRLNHKNLVRLLGYCEDSKERILVFEHMSNGTLHDHLHKLQKSSSNGGIHHHLHKLDRSSSGPSSPLTMSWAGRIKIALDAARGIEYLHVYADPQIIHRDIKSSNILLDAKYTAKVSDFGLSLIGPQDEDLHLSISPAGTMGYLDPEYYMLEQLTTKSDVYSFGVVLLELLSGRKVIHRNENGVPRNVVDYVVPFIVQDEIHRVLDRNVPPPTPIEIEAVAFIGYLATDCVQLQGIDRPTMTEIVNSLERALAVCLAPPPTLSRSTTDSST